MHDLFGKRHWDIRVGLNLNYMTLFYSFFFLVPLLLVRLERTEGRMDSGYDMS